MVAVAAAAAAIAAVREASVGALTLLPPQTLAILPKAACTRIPMQHLKEIDLAVVVVVEAAQV